MQYKEALVESNPIYFPELIVLFINYFEINIMRSIQESMKVSNLPSLLYFDLDHKIGKTATTYLINLYQTLLGQIQFLQTSNDEIAKSNILMKINNYPSNEYGLPSPKLLYQRYREGINPLLRPVDIPSIY